MVAAFCLVDCAESSNRMGTPSRPSTAGGPGAAGEPSTDEGGAPGDGEADSGGGGGRGGGGGSGPGLLTDPDAGSAGVSLGETCAADETVAEVVPLDMYLMIDTSASMLGQVGANSTKWSAVKSALRAFFRSKGAEGIGVGLQYFPLPKPDVPSGCLNDAACGSAAPCLIPGLCWYDLLAGSFRECLSENDCVLGGCTQQKSCEKDPTLACTGASCGEDEKGNDLGACNPIPVVGSCFETSVCEAYAYATPAQPVAALPNAANALISSLDARTPEGYTPTGPALSGALQQARTWAGLHPDHRVVAVLATDGSPTNCSPTNADEISDIAGDAFSDSPSVRTVVIGVLTQADVNAGLKASLDKIARKGGTGEATLVDATKDVTAQFQAALDAIRTDPLRCEFKIPEPVAGTNLDYAKVNVSFKSGKQSTSLYYVASVDDCDPDAGGWYYDHDPSREVPSTILVCPSNCTAFQASSSAKVQIALGCETIVK